MSTKVTILGGIPEPKKKKPIEFLYALTAMGSPTPPELIGTDIKPRSYKSIELVCGEYAGYDIMFAYNELRDEHHATLFVGHFNDGVVE